MHTKTHIVLKTVEN